MTQVKTSIPQPLVHRHRSLLFGSLLAAFAAVAGCATPEDPGTAYGNQLGAIQYTVKTGDNLVLIAADITRQRENWRRIADFNRIANPANLRVGQTIWIPKDLVPLDDTADTTRSIAGHPDAVVNSVQTPSTIKPVN